MTLVKESSNSAPKSAYRYDIFKGSVGADGSITKLRSIGSAYIREGQRTFLVTLKTFLEDRFYMLPDTRTESQNSYMILTREISRNLRKKYFWNTVGEARILEGPNHGLMKLNFDLLADDLYMSLHPINSKNVAEGEESIAA